MTNAGTAFSKREEEEEEEEEGDGEEGEEEEEEEEGVKKIHGASSLRAAKERH